MRYAIHCRTGHVVPATEEVLRNHDFWEITPRTALAIEQGKIKGSAALLQYRENMRASGISDPTPGANPSNNVRKSSFTEAPKQVKAGPFDVSLPVAPGMAEVSTGDTGADTPPAGGNGEGGPTPNALKIPPQLGQMKHASLLKFAAKHGVQIPEVLSGEDTPENQEAIREVLKAAASTPDTANASGTE